MIRVGIVGCGYWGPNLVRTFAEIEGAQLVTVSDLRSGRLDFVRRRHPLLKTTIDASDVLSDSTIDAVIIATPPDTHYALATQALNNGKHVFLEKPLATSVSDAEKIVDLAERAHRTLIVGHLFLYAPAVMQIRSLLQSGELGAIHYISSTRANLGPPKPKIDVLWDLAPHDLSIILDLMNDSPIEVVAQGASFTHADLADTVFLTLRFSDGRLAHIHVSWLTPNKIRLLQVVCSRGVAVYDDVQPVHKVQVHRPGIDNRPQAGDSDAMALSYGPGGMWAPPLQTDEPLRLECKDFIESIVSGRRPLSNGQRGLEVVRILERASYSLRHSGKIVSAGTPEISEAAGARL